MSTKKGKAKPRETDVKVMTVIVEKGFEVSVAHDIALAKIGIEFVDIRNASLGELSSAIRKLEGEK